MSNTGKVSGLWEENVRLDSEWAQGIILALSKWNTAINNAVHNVDRRCPLPEYYNILLGMMESMPCTCHRVPCDHWTGYMLALYTLLACEQYQPNARYSKFNFAEIPPQISLEQSAIQSIATHVHNRDNFEEGAEACANINLDLLPTNTRMKVMLAVAVMQYRDDPMWFLYGNPWPLIPDFFDPEGRHSPLKVFRHQY